MSPKRREDIKEQLKDYYLSFQKDGEPIPVNFRALAPELGKAERYTHLIHSYPAKLLANIPFFSCRQMNFAQRKDWSLTHFAAQVRCCWRLF